MRLTSKTGKPVQSIIVTVKSGMGEVKNRKLGSSSALTRWNLVRVLAIGGLMAVSAAMYFNLASEGAVGITMNEQNEEATMLKVAATYSGNPIDDDEWRFDSPYLEDSRFKSVPPAAKKGVGSYPGDDEWVYGPPYIQVYHLP